MAVHKGNPTNTSTQQPQTPQGQAYEGLGNNQDSQRGQQTTHTSTRLTDVLSGVLNANDTGDEWLDDIHQAMVAVLKPVNTSLMNIHVFKMLSNEQTHDSRLAFPTIVLVGSINNQVVYLPYFFVDMRQSDFDSMTVQVGQETFVLERHASEAMDEYAAADIKTVITRSLGMSDHTIYSPGAKCVRGLPDFNQMDQAAFMKFIRDLTLPGLRLVASTLLIEKTGTLKDTCLLNEVDRSKTNSVLNISFKTGADELRSDENGTPIGGNTTATIRVEQVKGDSSNSLNRQHKSYTIGTTTIRPSVVQGVSTFNSLFQQQVGQRQPMFIPQIVLEDMHIVGDPTAANLTLMVASVVPLLTPDVLRRMYNPKTVGFLNVRANLSNEAKAAPFAEKDVRENYSSLWDALFGRRLAVSVVIRLGSFSGIAETMFLRAGRDESGLRNALDALHTLTAGLNGPLNTKSVVASGYELIPIGTYRGADKNQHPLSDIDLAWLIEHFHSRPQLIDDWATSCEGTLSPLVAYGMKLQVLREVTNDSARVVDRGVVLTFTSEYIQHLAMCMRDNHLALTTNINQLTDLAPSRWAPYVGADSAIDLSTFSAVTGNMGSIGSMPDYSGFGYY